MNDTNYNLVKSLRENWPILIFIGSLIVLGVRFESRLMTLEKQMVGHEIKIENALAYNSEVRAQLAEIKTKLDFIKIAVEKIP